MPGIAWCVLSATGLVILTRRRPEFMRCVASASLALLAAVIVVRPSIAHAGIVFVRYNLPVAALLLLGVAVSLGVWIDSSSNSLTRGLRQGVTLALIIAWMAYGPLPELYRRPNNWTNHGLYQFDYDLEKSLLARILRPKRIPEFYRGLGSLEPGTVVIAEAPNYYEWHKSYFVYYQRVHRQHTILGEVNTLTPQTAPAFTPSDAMARLRNSIPLNDLRRLRSRGVRFVILHLDPRQEIAGWDPNDFIVNMAPVVWFFRRQCGPPTTMDETLVVFDLVRCTLQSRDDEATD
jgi:hypothetical protein